MDHHEKTISGRPKRKRCFNCGALFDLTKDWRRFCSDNCRKDWHKHGSAHQSVLRAVRKDLPKLIREAFKKPPQELLDAVIREIEKRRAAARSHARDLRLGS
jgi:hypothetical protein